MRAHLATGETRPRRHTVRKSSDCAAHRGRISARGQNKRYIESHRLRRTFATKLAEMKVPPHIVERLLNHKLGTLQTQGVITAVADVYNRAIYMDEMREAIGKWEARLSALLAS